MTDERQHVSGGPDGAPGSPGRRDNFDTSGLTLSYLDYGGDGPVLLALHGHLNEARFVDQGAVPAGTGFRVIALDQRGHGESDHAESYATDRYVDDAVALLDHLGVEKAVVLGHSLGGAVAYRLAARAPERVIGLIVVDIGAVVDDSLEITSGWPRRTATKEQLVEAMSFMGAKQAYVMRRYVDGWGVPWDSADMIASQQELNGDHWAEWLGSSMPVLLIHGMSSRQFSTEQADEMAARRTGTTLRHLTGGHAVYVDNPSDYTAEVRTFLQALGAQTVVSQGRSVDPRTMAETYFRAWKSKDFATLGALLAPEVTFRGPLGTADGAEECLLGLQGMSNIITDIVIRRIFVDGSDVLTWYDLHTTVAPPAATANWSSIVDGRFTTIRATFDARPFSPPGQ